jgi:hypothetical protein
MVFVIEHLEVKGYTSFHVFAYFFGQQNEPSLHVSVRQCLNIDKVNNHCLKYHAVMSLALIDMTVSELTLFPCALLHRKKQ